MNSPGLRHPSPLLTLFVAALASQACNKTPSSIPDEGKQLVSEVDPATLHSATCRVQLPLYNHDSADIRRRALMEAPKLTMTPSGAQIDHVPVGVGGLSAALEARDARRERERAGRAARFAAHVAYIEAIAARWTDLELRFIDYTGSNEFFEPLRDTLPEGFEMVVEQGYFTIKHPDLDTLRAFMSDKVDPEHIVGYERARRIDPAAGDVWVWQTHYVEPEVVLDGGSFETIETQHDDAREELSIALTATAEGTPKLADLTINNITRTLAIMSGDEVLLTTDIWELAMEGDALITLSPPFNRSRMEAAPELEGPYAFVAALDQRMELSQLREGLSDARDAMPEHEVVLVVEAELMRGISLDSSPELAAMLEESRAAARADKAKREEVTPGASDACPEVFKLATSLSSMFPSERSRYLDEEIQSAAWQTCACASAPGLFQVTTNTSGLSGPLALQFITLVEEPGDGFRVKNVPPTTTWAQITSELSPRECVDLGATGSPLNVCALPAP